jgi:hypothetical protein
MVKKKPAPCNRRRTVRTDDPEYLRTSAEIAARAKRYESAAAEVTSPLRGTGTGPGISTVHVPVEKFDLDPSEKLLPLFLPEPGFDDTLEHDWLREEAKDVDPEKLRERAERRLAKPLPRRPRT